MTDHRSPGSRSPRQGVLAGTVAARFLTKMVDLLDERDRANIGLTGGTMSAVLAAIRASPAPDTSTGPGSLLVGRRALSPPGDPDRNDRKRVRRYSTHIPMRRDLPFPAPDDHRRPRGVGRAMPISSPPQSTGRGAAIRHHVPRCGAGRSHRVAVPRPRARSSTPSQRGRGSATPETAVGALVLTLPVIKASDRIWLVLAGADKAGAIGLALAGANLSTRCPSPGSRPETDGVLRRREAAAKYPSPSSHRIISGRRGRHPRPEGAPTIIVDLLRSGSATLAKLLKRLVEELRRLFLAAALFHVGEVGLVRLDLRQLRRVVLVAAGGQTESGQSMISGISSSGRSAAKCRTVSLPRASQ